MAKTAAKTRVVHRCQQCGAAAPRWLGRCPECGEWGSLVEEVAAPRPLSVPVGGERALPIIEVSVSSGARRSTGIGELDRVLGGGLVAGSVTLLGGEPGIGKSTLLLQALNGLARAGGRALLVSAEESKEQVRLRAERLGTLAPTMWLLTETMLPAVAAAVDDVRPDILAVDSIQTVVDPDLGGTAGSVGQVRDCAHQLVRLAKERAIAVVLVGHVTKEGTLAGPRVLEHVVDTVLSFEGDRHHALRMLRAQKHRFGSTDELGLFEMCEHGLEAVRDPSVLFLGDRRTGIAGSVVTAMLEGSRPLLLEVQALVPKAETPVPRRSAQGFDPGRLALLLGVLRERAGVKLGDRDVYASVAGGVRVAETGIDLALTLALASAAEGSALPGNLVAVGEVGLLGEIRQVPHTARRLAEAARVGFTTALVPATAPDVAGMTSVRVATVREALAAVGFSPRSG